MLRLLIILAAALSLSGCAGLICNSGPLTQRLTALESGLYEVEDNIARGYAVHVSYRTERVATGTKLVSPGDTETTIIYETVSVRDEKPVAIDIAHEKEKARMLRSQVNALLPRARAERDSCLARHA